VKDDKDEIDPELVRLGRGTKVGPVLALSVLGLSAYLLVTLRADFSYANRAEDAEDAGTAAALLARPAPPANTLVSVVAALDFRAPARLWAREGKGHRLAPALGTGGRLWIHQEKDAYGTTPVDDGRFAGRLRRLSDVPFETALRQYFDSLPPQPRTVFPEALATGIPAVDVAGEPLVLAPDTRLVVDENTDTVLVTFVQTDSVVDDDSARRALAAAGLPSPTAPGEAALGAWTYEIPGDVAAVQGKLHAARIFGAAVDPKLVRHEGVRRDLSVGAGGLTLAGRTLPWARVQRVTFFVPAALPADAWVLLQGETPASLWYVRPLFIAVAALGALMLWALVRQFLRARPGKL
jgi:hypothetical protein